MLPKRETKIVGGTNYSSSDVLAIDAGSQYSNPNVLNNGEIDVNGVTRGTEYANPIVLASGTNYIVMQRG